MNKAATIEQVAEEISITELVEVKNIELPPKRVVNIDIRKAILAIEKKIKSMPGALGEDPFPLKHSFAKGVYVREVIIPKGYFVVGKLHKDTYLNCVLSGDMSVLTEEGLKRIKGPCWNISPEGTKRFGFSHEDTVWITAHPNPDECRDIKMLEDRIHIKEYSELPQVIDIGECKELTYFVDELARLKESNFDTEKFIELSKNVFEKEKEGFWSDWTKDQQELYMSGDWEAFSKSRGYTDLEISELRLWITMKEDGESKGLNPLSLIKNIINVSALKNIMKDVNGEINLSSHVPSNTKSMYKEGGDLCLL